MQVDNEISSENLLVIATLDEVRKKERKVNMGLWKGDQLKEFKEKMKNENLRGMKG